MSDIEQSTSATICLKCGSRADVGRIFCRMCGAALKAPSALIPSNDGDVSKSALSPLKQFLAAALKFLVGVAGTVLLLCPLQSGTQWLVFAGSLAVW